MRFLTLLSTFSLISLALSAPRLLVRQVRCSPPMQSLTVQNFRSFTAAQDSTSVSSVSFSLFDSFINQSVECGRSLPPGSGRSAVDPDHFYPCNGGNVQFEYGETFLALRYNYQCNNNTVRVVGNVTLGVFCYTENDAVFDGQTCLTPTGFLNVPIKTTGIADVPISGSIPAPPAPPS